MPSIRTTQTRAHAQPVSADRYAAYRHLALTIVGADIQTLLTQLRDRRDVPPKYVRLPPPESRAA